MYSRHKLLAPWLFQVIDDYDLTGESAAAEDELNKIFAALCHDLAEVGEDKSLAEVGN